MKTVSWLDGWRALTICPFASRIVNIIGRWAVAPMTIPVFRNLVCKAQRQLEAVGSAVDAAFDFGGLRRSGQR
jgi:hypothetical protein